MWQIKAKAYPNETRSSEAVNVEYWLRPGSYTVGRKKSEDCDIAVIDDKSISRIHATIKVPSLNLDEGTVPYVSIVDSSSYGTFVTSSDDLSPSGQTKITLRAENRNLVRFGYLSPFRCVERLSNTFYI